MIVRYDGDLVGYVGNVFASLDEFWVCEEHSNEVVCQDGDFRIFCADELLFTGAYSPLVEGTEVVEMPGAIIDILIDSIQGCELGVDVDLEPPAVTGGMGKIFIGPGPLHEVNAAAVIVRKRVDELTEKKLDPAESLLVAKSAAVDACTAKGQPPAHPSVAGAYALLPEAYCESTALPQVFSPQTAAFVEASAQVAITSSSVPPPASEGRMTVAQWAEAQAQFAHLPVLPPGWIRIRSNSTRSIYYYNLTTNETSFTDPTELSLSSAALPEAAVPLMASGVAAPHTPAFTGALPPVPVPASGPLPIGWQEFRSRSTMRIYYWNAQTGISSFLPPTS